ncbi:MAG: FHA domain-containing protein [Myxococcota bacterium]|jgi:pSer/pThr/pTyr-binding forkhead associated (FHA) protein|nr:FHA domain-containing protein [Myxococcota bacterium]
MSTRNKNDDFAGSLGFDGTEDDALANALLEALGQGTAAAHVPPPGPPPLPQAESSSPPVSKPPDGAEDSGLGSVHVHQQAGVNEVNCPSCGAVNPAGNRYCGSCGASLADLARRNKLATEAYDRREVDVDVRLISINEDGSDGIEIPLRFNETIIGRAGDTRFPTDAFLSPKHARLLIESAHLYIEDLFSLNGTYVRIRDEILLSPGDCFLMGRQVLRFERFEQTISPKSRAADGTRYMGSPPSGGEFKLLQLGIGGVYQNVYCLPESGAVLGREKGDITFPRDRFMSSRHAQIYPRDDGNYYLVDLNSSNGTWTKIWERYELGHGDLIFLGQQLFRVEAPYLG